MRKLIKLRRAIALLLLTLAFSATNNYAADTQLDPSFGTNGHVGASINAYRDTARKVLRYADGRYLVVGDSYGNSSALVMIRYLANGSLDASFGTNGMVISNSCSGFEVSDAALDSQSRIVIAAASFCRFSGNFVLYMRFGIDGAADGSLRFTFGNSGSNNGTDNIPRSLIVLPDDSVLIGGLGRNGTESSSAIQKISASGNLVGSLRLIPGFAGFTASIPAGNNASYWLEQMSGNSFARVRKINNDTLADDPSFGDAGVAILNAVPTSGNTACVSGTSALHHFANKLVLLNNTIKVLGYASNLSSSAPVNLVYFSSLDLTGTNASYRHGCLTTTGENMRGLAAVADDFASPAVYVAGECLESMCFTRFIPNPNDAASLTKDPNFNAGNAVLMPFAAPGAAYGLHRTGRHTVLVGSGFDSGTHWRMSTARFGTELLVDGFE
jgi:hypothetical protein